MAPGLGGEASVGCTQSVGAAISESCLRGVRITRCTQTTHTPSDYRQGTTLEVFYVF